MPRLFRHVDDVALIGEEDRERADPVADLSLEDDPELCWPSMLNRIWPSCTIHQTRVSGWKRRGVFVPGAIET